MFSPKHKKRFIQKLSLGLLGALFVCAFASPSVSAYNCKVDPDYPKAGTYNTPNSAECTTNPQYTFTGDPKTPSILYEAVSQVGTKSTKAGFELVDANADPLVWRGNALYGSHHEIRIVINKADFTNSRSGVPFKRYDSLTDTKNGGIYLNDIGERFADAQGIAVADEREVLERISTEVDCKEANLSKDNCGIVRYLLLFINALSALVGLAVVIMIIVGGIEYAAAADNPQKVSAAKSKIINALLALLMFIFMYAFLQWVVPGGIL